MMERQSKYDVGIIGGGLAGLSTAIQLAKKGYAVALFEKETYPFHKVCGEYISLESQGFLQSLGVPLNEWKVPVIDTLLLTAPNGKEFKTRLPLGGFGISRYKLDHSLAQIAIVSGVHLFEATKVDAIEYISGKHIIYFAGRNIEALVCCAAYGKRSNLDVKWNRPFIMEKANPLNSYVGVKHHIQTSWPGNVIGLHNFKNGYCGISKIEDDKFCLCYMTKAQNLKACNNSIAQMQQTILFQNPHLKKIFESSKIVNDFPITISQINFSPKSKVENGVLMLGDSAGMITPLCGNGMSIALHTSKIAAGLIDDCLQLELSDEQLKTFYEKRWKETFAARLKTGRLIQRFFGSHTFSNFFVATFKALPFLAKPVIRLTHGKPF